MSPLKQSIAFHVTLSVFPITCLISHCWSQPIHHHPSKQSHIDQAPLTPRQIAKMAMPSVVRLTVLDASGQPSVLGSGFVVGDNLIATNVHVIAGAHAVTANFLNGRSETVPGLVNADTKRDIAIIYANTKGIRPLLLAPNASGEIGDPVVAVGSPEGYDGSVSTGIISAFRTIGIAKVIQTTAAISHGSSGGPLLDSYGRVVGITSLFDKEGQSLNFAFASQYIRQLIPAKKPQIIAWAEIEAIPQATANASVASTPQTSPADMQRIIDLVNDYNSLLTQEGQLIEPVMPVSPPEPGSFNQRAADQLIQTYTDQFKAYLAQQADLLSKALSLYTQVKDNPQFLRNYVEGDRCTPIGLRRIEWAEGGYYNLRFIQPRALSDTKEKLNILQLDHEVEDYKALVALAHAFQPYLNGDKYEPGIDLFRLPSKETVEQANAMNLALPLYRQILTNPLFSQSYHLGNRVFDSAHTPFAVMGTDAERLTEILHN